MPHLTEEQKIFIVRRLACFHTPTEVAEDVKEEFGIEIAREHVRSYNPLQVEVAEKWREIFDTVRKAYREQVLDVPIANERYRLQERQFWYEREKGRKNPNPAVAQEILDQAARDTGGAFTSRRDVTLADPDEVLARILGVSKDKLPT